MMKVSELHNRAVDLGISKDDIDKGLDAAAPKDKLISLILASDATPAGSGGCTKQAVEPTGSTSQRSHRKYNRWGTNSDAPHAGRREFFKAGWIPTRDANEA